MNRTRIQMVHYKTNIHRNFFSSLFFKSRNHDQNCNSEKFFCSVNHFTVDSRHFPFQEGKWFPFEVQNRLSLLDSGSFIKSKWKILRRWLEEAQADALSRGGIENRRDQYKSDPEVEERRGWGEDGRRWRKTAQDCLR